MRKCLVVLTSSQLQRGLCSESKWTHERKWTR
jgi:hypothetical protein